MGTLERVMQMRQVGQSDSQIIDALRREGVSPKEIHESLSQSKIKSALSQETINEAAAYEQEGQNFQQMQPSMMQTQEPQQFAQQIEEPIQQIPSSYQPSTSDYYSQANESYQAYYPEYTPGSDMETVNEIADQIVEEKTAQLKKQMDFFTKFKEDIGLEIEKINERLLRIENTLNELQMAIIGKIGEYGRDIKNISKEMHATQDSFSKILNPLTDNIRQMQGINGNEEATRPRPKTKTEKKSDKSNFEDYLR
ncbi:MAG: hypothetical protein PHH54_04110 [Candidatus Nanoarchaeia archaeon]|nr:hypothetical protein [Candidatus Nanoarchaeia archaeon]MDD5741144.1 hypothetical protein [Candidatus Nanoarchaeia archaeon]